MQWGQARQVCGMERASRPTVAAPPLRVQWPPGARKLGPFSFAWAENFTKPVSYFKLRSSKLLQTYMGQFLHGRKKTKLSLSVTKPDEIAPSSIVGCLLAPKVPLDYLQPTTFFCHSILAVWVSPQIPNCLLCLLGLYIHKTNESSNTKQLSWGTNDSSDYSSQSLGIDTLQPTPALTPLSAPDHSVIVPNHCTGLYFHSAHPTKWAEFITYNISVELDYICVYLCPSSLRR